MDEFLADDRSLPNRPTHLVADIASKGLLFRQKLDAMNAALATRKTASNLIESSVKSMDTLIRWAKNILPTLTDESILLPFGLDRDIPRDYAAIKDYADTVDVYWQTVKLEPLYAPVAARMDEFAVLIAAYETGRADQTTADGEYSQRQNEKDIARADYNDTERRAFNWYASYYTDGQDMYWEQTPWGKAYGESEGGEEPGVNETPWGMVQGLEVVFDPIGNIWIKWKKVAGAVKYSLLRSVVLSGEPAPPEPYPVFRTGIPGESFTDTDFAPGKVYYYSVVAVNEAEEETEPCAGVGIEVM